MLQKFKDIDITDEDEVAHIFYKHDLTDAHGNDVDETLKYLKPTEILRESIITAIIENPTCTKPILEWIVDDSINTIHNIPQNVDEEFSFLRMIARKKIAPELLEKIYKGMADKKVKKEFKHQKRMVLETLSNNKKTPKNVMQKLTKTKICREIRENAIEMLNSQEMYWNISAY